METKHTKGNWEYDKYGSISVNGKTIVIHGCIATTMHDDEEYIANAKLIAAAPDLLGVLQRALSDFRNGKWTEETYNIVEQAINKATL